MSMETYHGHVKSAMDAIILFEACRLGTLPRVQRRLTEKERLSIRSGSVFVWDEREAGMRRWTDGKSWSASRVSGSFLTYREMEGRREGGEVYHVSAGPVEHVTSAESANRNGHVSSSGHVNSSGSAHGHVDASANPRGPGESSESAGADSANSRDPSPDSIQLITTPEGYRYKPDGLMKQSFSITTSTDLRLHLISYFNRSATEDGLLQPCEDEKLKKIKIPPGLYPDASALIDLYNNPKGKGLQGLGVGPNPGGPNMGVPGPNPGPNPGMPIQGGPNPAHGHPGHPGHPHPGNGHVHPNPGPHPGPHPHPGHVQTHPSPNHVHHPNHHPYGPPQHHQGYYPHPGHPGNHPGPSPHPGMPMQAGPMYYHPNPMAPPGYYPVPGHVQQQGPPGHVPHMPQQPHVPQGHMTHHQGQPGHVTHQPGHVHQGQSPRLNGHGPAPNHAAHHTSPQPGHPTPPSSHVTIKQEHVIPSPHLVSAHVSHNPSPVTTPQMSATPKMSRVEHSPRSPGHVTKTNVKGERSASGHVRTASGGSGHVRSVSGGHSPISHASPRVTNRVVSSPHVTSPHVTSQHVPRSSLKRSGSPAALPAAKEVKLELPSVAQLLKAQDIPYEKVQWGEDTQMIQALDKGFL